MITDVHFLEGLPGLTSAQDFALTQIDDQGLLFSLRGGTDGSTRLFVIQPGPYFAEYEPTIARDALDALGLGEADEQKRAVLVIVTPGSDTSTTTANLLAPVVLNTETGAALQVILEGTPWPVRAPLVAA
ncbi:flagellar assembly protein FliW [Sanguibacter suaedae]|uniref:Flagellar assembly factor FliW n=1 Tax=Sanguibacter suaedae TaxID=2795737 RepID=A0A934I2U3_9MICO|nr:flagellar assembly protein FliW [Sanguibacter suaedae]MBI9114559.1 flagellar assembly protein FliW [Sanguibacter suaedae]